MSDEGTKPGDEGKTDPPADEGKITYEPGDEGKTDPCLLYTSPSPRDS